MAQLPRGITCSIGSTIATALTVSGVSNATEAVVTSASHGLSNGDVVLMSSGWGRLHRRAARIKSSTTNTFALEGVDTSNTSLFPAGSGTGTASKVSALTQISSVLELQTSGGDAKQVSYSFYDNDVDYSINDGFNATNYTIVMDADAVSSAGYTALRTLTDVQTDTVFKIVLRNGAVLYVPCTVALNDAVQFQSGQINRVSCAINGTNRPIRYSS